MTEREKALREALEIVEEAHFNAVQHGQASPWLMVALDEVKALLKPANGWIPWEGGECPVDPETLVQLKYPHHGIEEVPVKAGTRRWEYSPIIAANIIAYKIISEPESHLDRPVTVRELVEAFRHCINFPEGSFRPEFAADWLERKARGES